MKTKDEGLKVRIDEIKNICKDISKEKNHHIINSALKRLSIEAEELNKYLEENRHL